MGNMKIEAMDRVGETGEAFAQRSHLYTVKAQEAIIATQQDQINDLTARLAGAQASIDDRPAGGKLEREADRAAPQGWIAYHSALSRCAELLPNMQDGDPLTEIPVFLARHLSALSILLGAPGAPSVNRNSVLEEAAKVCDAENAFAAHPAARRCAVAVRALKSAAPVAQPLAASASPEAEVMKLHVYGFSAWDGNYTRLYKERPNPWTANDDGGELVRRGDVLKIISATPAAPTVPTDDADLLDAMKKRDSYHETADLLAYAIAEHLNVGIGEHSSDNCPWRNALAAIAAAPQQVDAVQAVPTVAWLIEWTGPDGTKYSEIARHNAVGDYFYVDENATATELVRRLASPSPAAPKDAQGAVPEGPIDANKLEELATARPDECFLTGRGVLKLIGAIRTLEQRAALAAPQPVASAQAVPNGEAIRKAMRQAYNLGQTYFSQADSDYVSQHKKSEETARRFQELLESTVAMVAAPQQPAPTGQAVPTWQERRADWLKRKSQKREGPPSNDQFTTAEIADLRRLLAAPTAQPTDKQEG